MSTGTHCCSPSTPSIRAVLENKGSFVIGTIATLIFKLNDANGNPSNPTNVKIDIKQSNGNSIIIRGANGQVIPSAQAIPQKVANGFFVFDWFIDKTQIQGTYTIQWTYNLLNESYINGQQIIVSKKGNQSSNIVYDPIMIAWVTKLQRVLGCLNCMPIYRQPAKQSYNCYQYYFTRPNWNRNPSQTKIYRNDQTIITDGLTIDYDAGCVIFDSKMASYDNITADYSYRWLTQQDLSGFILDGVEMYNSYPPMGSFNYVNTPPQSYRIIIDYAAIQSIRKIMACLITPEPQQLFGGQQAAKSAFSNLQTMKKNLQGQMNALLTAKKFGPYPKSQFITAPILSLPGGRSRFFRSMFSSNVG